MSTGRHLPFSRICLTDRFVQGCSVDGIRFYPGGPGPHPAEAAGGAGHAHAHRAHEGQQRRR